MDKLYTEIGKISSVHGLKGEFKIKIDQNYNEDLSLAKVVFLNVKGQMIPFFIENLRSPSNWILKLEEIGDPESAKTYSKSLIFLKTEDILSDSDRNIPIYQNEFLKVVGYSIFNNEIKVGDVDRIEEFPHQTMLVVKIGEKEALIPMVDAFIIKIEDLEKTIYLSLPDGLFDL